VSYNENRLSVKGKITRKNKNKKSTTEEYLKNSLLPNKAQTEKETD
jgi:hypothetical protein